MGTLPIPGFKIGENAQDPEIRDCNPYEYGSNDNCNYNNIVLHL